MLDIKTFREVKELQEEGVIASKIMRRLNISKSQYFKWCLLSEETFLRHLKNKKSASMENYREFIVSILKITPQINDTTILYRCLEEFDDFDIPKMTFLRGVRKIREESGYVKTKRRLFGTTEETLPGYEAQVDFGQTKIKDMYNHTVHLYFFCMILSYSRMKFCYFSRDPFTTKTAILAHDYAFQYFGGRTQSILYDQSRLFLVSENFGDFILTKEFEDYVLDMGFTVNFCHKYDPQSKAKVEGTVWTIKHQFLDGRIYTGIDVLNESCLEWLDRFGNGDYHRITKKIPRDMFKDEYPKLTKVKIQKRDNTCILTVKRYENVVKYKNNNYAIPPEEKLDGCRVKVVEKDGELYIYRPITNELICKHKVETAQGKILSSRKSSEGENTECEFLLNKFFGDNKVYKDFRENTIRQGNPSFIGSQLRRYARMTRYYTKEELLTGMRFCLRNKKCSAYEISSYLIYKYGVERARVYLHDFELSHFKKRALEIREELEDGRHK